MSLSPDWGAIASRAWTSAPSVNGSASFPKLGRRLAPPSRHRSAPERAAGRVDITDELRRYVLYRFQEDGSDVWLIDDLKSGPKPLDQDAFESALMSYLQ